MDDNRKKRWNCWITDPYWKGQNSLQPIQVEGADENEARINAALQLNEGSDMIPEPNAAGIVCRLAEE